MFILRLLTILTERMLPENSTQKRRLSLLFANTSRKKSKPLSLNPDMSLPFLSDMMTTSPWFMQKDTVQRLEAGTMRQKIAHIIGFLR